MPVHTTDATTLPSAGFTSMLATCVPGAVHEHVAVAARLDVQLLRG